MSTADPFDRKTLRDAATDRDGSSPTVNNPASAESEPADVTGEGEDRNLLTMPATTSGETVRDPSDPYAFVLQVDPPTAVGSSSPRGDHIGTEAERTVVTPLSGDSSAVPIMARSDRHATSAPRERPVPVIDGYEILGELGRGGMGVVYKARQTHLNRACALKMILGGAHAGPEQTVRFLAEARAIAQLQHHHIVQIHHIGETEGLPFFELEYVDGGSLEKRLDGTPWPPQRAAEMVEALARGVVEAHRLGIIHRDLKPGNVLLAGDGTPKITDFGLAKSLTMDSGLTATDAIMGSPGYMAPEQAEGHAKQVGPLADVYALGAILYELLTGRPPFRAATVLETLEQVKITEPVPPSRLVPGLPRDVETIALKCLQKEPEKRYDSASALADDLNRFLAGKPIVARPVPFWERAFKWGRRRPAVAALVVVVLALLASLLGLGIWSYAEINRSLTVAKAESKRALEQTSIARAQTQVATEKAENLAWEDYINRVNRAYREVMDDNVALAEDLLFGCAPGRRGWEWHYVMRLCHLDLLTLDGSLGSVNRVAYSPDGLSIAFGSGKPTTLPVVGSTDEARVELWNGAKGRSQTLPAFEGTIHSLAISPDGKRIAVGSGFKDPRIENRITIWDVVGGAIVWEKRDSVFPAVASLAFSPDGTTLAAGYGDYSWLSAGRVTLFDVESGRERISFPGPAGGVNDLSFHPKGTMLAIAGSKIVELRSVENGAKIRDLPGHTLWVYSIAFSPDGNWLASGGWDRTIKLRDVATGQERLTIFGHDGFVYGLAFSPDSRALASTSEDRSLKLWEVPSGRELVVFHGHTDFVNDVSFHPGGQEMVTGSQDGTLKVWNRRKSRSVVVDHQLPWVQRLAYRRDGQRILSMAGTTLLGQFNTKSWDPTTGEFDPEQGRFEWTNPADLPPEYNPGVAYGQDSASSPNGRLVAQVVRPDFVRESRSRRYAGSTVEVRDTQTGQVVHTLTGHTADVTCMLFSPDGQRLATASFDRTIKLWDLVTGREVCTLRGHTAGVISLAFSPDGRRLISGGIEGISRVWDATPLPDDALQELEARLQRKRSMLRELTRARDNSQSAESLAQDGQWERAAIAFERAMERQPENPELRYWLALCRLAAKDLPGYRKVCGAMLERFGLEDAPGIASRVAYTCVAGPDAVEDRARLRQICNKAIPAFEGNERILGAALVRDGRDAEALEQFDASHRTFPPRAWDWLFRAMAYHGLDQPAEARDCLERADRWISVADGKTAFQGDGAQPKWVHWSERIEVQTLRREVESLVQEHLRAAPSSAPSTPTKSATREPGAKPE